MARYRSRIMNPSTPPSTKRGSGKRTSTRKMSTGPLTRAEAQRYIDLAEKGNNQGGFDTLTSSEQKRFSDLARKASRAMMTPEDIVRAAGGKAPGKKKSTKKESKMAKKKTTKKKVAKKTAKKKTAKRKTTKRKTTKRMTAALGPPRGRKKASKKKTTKKKVAKKTAKKRTGAAKKRGQKLTPAEAHQMAIKGLQKQIAALKKAKTASSSRVATLEGKIRSLRAKLGAQRRRGDLTLRQEEALKAKLTKCREDISRCKAKATAKKATKKKTAKRKTTKRKVAKKATKRKVAKKKTAKKKTSKRRTRTEVGTVRVGSKLASQRKKAASKSRACRTKNPSSRSRGQITDRMIRDLAAEAGAAGDVKMVKVCKRALDGSSRARRECSDLINYARAQNPGVTPGGAVKCRTRPTQSSLAACRRAYQSWQKSGKRQAKKKKSARATCGPGVPAKKAAGYLGGKQKGKVAGKPRKVTTAEQKKIMARFMRLGGR